MPLVVLLMLALFSCAGPVAAPSAPAPSAPAPRVGGVAEAANRTLKGRVMGAEGLVAGASVAISTPGGEGDGFFESVLTGPSGEFSVSVPPGSDYVISAHHGGWGFSVQAARDAGSKAGPLELQLERQDESTAGVLRDEMGQPIAGGQIELSRRTAPGRAEAFVVANTDREGRFELRVPRGSYVVVSRFQKQKAAAAPFVLPVAAGLSLRLFREGPSNAPPSPEELEFVRKHRRPLANGGGVWTADWLRGVEFVGIGEQTHGAREAVVARFELAKALITDHGFNVVALETGYEAAWTLGEWTRGKPGDVRVALDRLGMWLWQTREMVEFSSWLRAENARRGPGKGVELVGVYGYTYFPTKLEALRDRLQTSGAESRSRLLREVPNVSACAQLDPAFASDERWARARERDPVLTLMLDSIRRCDLEASTAGAGELFAAEVCQRVSSMRSGAAQGPRKLVLLAHNAHVARARVGRAQQDILGQYLASSLGARYRAVGVTIGNGRFNGSFFDPKSGYAQGRRSLELDEIRAGSLESVLSTGGGSFFLPSRSPEGELWPGPARSTRDIGASYSPSFAEHYWSPVLLQNTYDAIVYVPHVEPIIERPWGQ